MLKDNLLMLRGIHGYSQEEIAEKIGISRQAYAKWESGATIPDIEKCSRLAQVYGTTVDGLLKTEELDDGHVLPPAPKGKNVWGAITMNERGQIVIPAKARRVFGLKPGDELILLGDEEQGIAVIKSQMFLQMIEELRLSRKTRRGR